jgi:hypothetical protein
MDIKRSINNTPIKSVKEFKTDSNWIILGMGIMKLSIRYAVNVTKIEKSNSGIHHFFANFKFPPRFKSYKIPFFPSERLVRRNAMDNGASPPMYLRASVGIGI